MRSNHLFYHQRIKSPPGEVTSCMKMFQRTNGCSSFCPVYKGKEDKEEDLGSIRRVDEAEAGAIEERQVLQGLEARTGPVLSLAEHACRVRAMRHSAKCPSSGTLGPMESQTTSRNRLSTFYEARLMEFK